MFEIDKCSYEEPIDIHLIYKKAKYVMEEKKIYFKRHAFVPNGSFANIGLLIKLVCPL